MRKIEDVVINCKNKVCKVPVNKEGVYILIDEEDKIKIDKYCWLACRYSRSNTMYASSPGYKYKTKGTCLMHRIILNAPKHLQVDHINGNGLDNRKINLRLCSNKNNSVNCISRTGKSKYKGVCSFAKNRWRAYIQPKRKQISLGCYDKEEDAAKAYNKAAKKIWGKYAKLNIIE